MTNGPAHIVTLDQEQRGLVAVVDGGPTRPFTPAVDLGDLPDGGGLVVADRNTWAVRNPRSQSQYCWGSQRELDDFLLELAVRGYRAVSVANKHANTLYVRFGLPQTDAVTALALHVHASIAEPAPPGSDPTFACGCARHRSFDGGSTVTPGSSGTIDRSFGQRAVVANDFLVLQNRAGGYDCPFVDGAVNVVWAGLSGDQRDLLGLKKTRPEAKLSRNKVAALAVCTHDPRTGKRRTHNGGPWGVGFICDRVIGLNGTMRGTGPRAPGNPMRAVLRNLGRGRHPERLNAVDTAARAAIRALRASDLPPVDTSA
jgi:hypothetical protein